MKKNCIQVRSVQNYCLRWTTEAQAVRMVEAGTHVWRNSSTIQAKTLERRDESTPASLSKAEMVANALGAESSKTVSLSELKKLERAARGLDAEDYIERAIEKVKAWPLIGDTKAVRVSPA